MDDVKNEVVDAPQQEAPAEVDTAEEGSQPSEQTPDISVPQPEVKVDKTVPYDRFSEVNKKYREMQKKMAEIERASKLQGFDPNDLEQIMSHPLVQDMMIKEAKRELQDFTREALDNYPNLHPAVKKAILSNVRGFVNEQTTDVETAKMDVMEYIESISEEAQVTPVQPKEIKVAATNTSVAEASGTQPAEIAKIMAKAIDEWTPEDEAAIAAYTRSKK